MYHRVFAVDLPAKSEVTYPFLGRNWTLTQFWMGRSSIFLGLNAALKIFYYKTWFQLWLSNGVNAARNASVDLLIERFHGSGEWRLTAINMRKMINSMDQGNLIIPFSIAGKETADIFATAAGFDTTRQIREGGSAIAT